MPDEKSFEVGNRFEVTNADRPALIQGRCVVTAIDPDGTVHFKINWTEELYVRIVVRSIGQASST